MSPWKSNYGRLIFERHSLFSATILDATGFKRLQNHFSLPNFTIVWVTMSETTPNPLRSLSISPTFIADNAADEPRLRPPSETPYYAFISTKYHPTLPLSIHNYNQRAFWSSSPLAPYATRLETILDTLTLSTKEEASLALTLASRALVTHTTTGKVISRSFQKFFNFYEKMAYKPTGEEFAFEIQEKVDGSIISLFWYDEISPGIGNSVAVTGQWIVASKSSFSSPHTESAWSILNTRYPALLDPKTSPLDRSRTYVFELVDSRMPLKVHYPYGSDLVLLAIIAKDGSEPRWGMRGELDVLPFRRPRVWKPEELLGDGSVKAGESRLGNERSKLLSKLDRQNEEGFVVTFWRTKEDTHPQRFKVKLECYLKSNGNNTPDKLASSLAKMSVKRPLYRSNSIQLPLRGPPTPASLLQIYMSHRMSIPSFVGIDAQMSAVKQALLDSIQDLDIMDDYGGEAWLMKISTVWDRIDALISIQEDEWKDTIKKLEAEGYKPKLVGRKAKTLNEFEKRLTKSDVDKTLRRPLRTWFEGKGVKEVVKTVLECMEFPKDLKTEDVILLG